MIDPVLPGDANQCSSLASNVMICIPMLWWKTKRKCPSSYHNSPLHFVSLLPTQLQWPVFPDSESLVHSPLLSQVAVVRERILVTMHARDIMGFLLLMLVVTEMSRKYMTMQDLARMQAEAERLTKLFELNQALSINTQARKLLAQPAVRESELPLLCQAPGMDCLPGEEVRCEIGRHAGCDCEYIRACFPRASECTFLNATHITSCGF